MAKIGGQIIPRRILFLLCTEVFLIAFGLLAATRMRLGSNDALLEFVAEPQGFVRLALVVAVCGMALYYCDVYDLRESIRRAVLFVSLMQALGLACLVLAIVYYVQPTLALGRGVGMVSVPISIVLILGWRLLLDSFGVFSRGKERLLILGTATTGVTLAQAICARPELNYRVVGFLDEQGENIGKSLVNPGIVGGVADVRRIAEVDKIERIVVSLADRRGCMPVRELLQLRLAGIAVEDAHTIYERITGRILLDHLSPSWLILSEGFGKSPFLMITKRILDIAVALFALVVSLPITALVALAIFLESGRPILFRQSRVGFGGREFTVLKFRSMRQDTAMWSYAKVGDRRVTRVGKIIRKLRFDEIPQFWNVLRGEMSLVGPRPEMAFFAHLLEEKLPFFTLRHTVRPGITGWAQIKYRYGETEEDAKVKLELDLFYIKHLSIFLDLAIILETVKVVLLGRGAR